MPPQPPRPTAATAQNLLPQGIETFYGFISSPVDALHVVQACRQGQLKALNERPKTHDRNAVRSGSIIVFDESGSRMRRWRDGMKWTPSRISGPFLIYREIETVVGEKVPNARSMGAVATPGPGSLMPPTKGDSAFVPGIDPAYSANLKGSSVLKEDGLIKKTMVISLPLMTSPTSTPKVNASDSQNGGSSHGGGDRFHVVCYYSRLDVLEGRLPFPSSSPLLADVDVPEEFIASLPGASTSTSSSSASHTANG
ncbi:Gti1/Pac2 family-domain-containing protein, partial [Chytridium lagenaria]